MSRTLLKRIDGYIDPEEARRLHELIGAIPRSRIVALAVHRLITDIESGNLSLVPKIGRGGIEKSE